MVLWKGCKQKYHGESIIKISDGVYKSGVPLLHNAIQGVDRFVVIHLVGLHFLSLVQRPLHPPDEGPKVSEFLQKRLVGEELDVLYVVVRLVCSAAMVYLLLVLGLVWVDALEYTQTPEIREGQL